jgi:hypothetical protein
MTHTDPYRGLIHLQPSQTNLSGARVPQLEFATDLPLRRPENAAAPK